MAEEQETSTTQENQTTDSQTSDKSATESDDLDAILSEYEDSTETETQESKESGEDDEVKQWIREQKAKEANKEAVETVNQAVGRMKEREGLKNVPDSVLADILWGKAGQEARIRVAYAQRHKNPSGWNKVVDALGKDLEKAFQLPDSKLSEDHEAVKAAVSSASNRDPEPEGPSAEQVNRMTDKEFFEKFGIGGPFQ